MVALKHRCVGRPSFHVMIVIMQPPNISTSHLQTHSPNNNSPEESNSLQSKPHAKSSNTNHSRQTSENDNLTRIKMVPHRTPPHHLPIRIHHRNTAPLPRRRGRRPSP